ncbi:hypothetical protein RIF29_27309 [Crotalaria pallida]|uniref:Uncharacterized protein n=1 Tax=Crotalaria pallida TaxID=3830 RepID=A0AAN9EPH3_CROPI
MDPSHGIMLSDAKTGGFAINIDELVENVDGFSTCLVGKLWTKCTNTTQHNFILFFIILYNFLFHNTFHFPIFMHLY